MVDPALRPAISAALLPPLVADNILAAAGSSGLLPKKMPGQRDAAFSLGKVAKSP